jgi:hypothetical protein
VPDAWVVVVDSDVLGGRRAAVDEDTFKAGQ